MDALRTRTIKIPVAEVVDGGTKMEFYRDLRDSLRSTVLAFNRCLTECAVIDREAHDTSKVTKCPKIYTYPVISDRFPGNASIASSVARAAEKAYRQKRFQIVTGRASIPLQRSCPMPLLHNKSVKILKLFLDDQGVLASFRFLNGKSYKVRLRGGSNYARPLRTIRSCIESDAIGDSKIWVDGRGMAVLGIACGIPKTADVIRTGILRVQTARDAFIVATKEAVDTPFTINADHVQRWLAERWRRQQRLRQDRKSGYSREAIKAVQSKVSAKHNHRLDSFTHESSSHIVQHARRRRVARLEYDSTIRSYFGSDFPWHDFATKLKYKCEDAGIEFQEVSSEIMPADLDEPHVYFVTPVVDGKVNGRVKIGMTTQQGGKRKKSLEMAGGCDELLVLATAKAPKSKLRQLEKHYHAMFAEHCIDGQKEWFEFEPIIGYLREVGSLGNAGNLSQITQYMEA